MGKVLNWAAALVFAGMLVAGAPAMAFEDDDSDAAFFNQDEDWFSGVTGTRQTVAFNGDYARGTIIVRTRERKLYYVLGNGKALQYGVGVGRKGFTWAGRDRVSRKAAWPSWRPPAEMRKRQPGLPVFMPGGPRNPLGARALYIGSSLYRIHGTNAAHTIGRAVSSGCIRMLNQDVIDLFNRVRVGAPVVVTM